MNNPFAAASDLQWTGGYAPFRGAQPHRLYMDRLGQASQVDSELRYSLRELRARARDLRRNNPYATGIVESFQDNIVGWEGIRCKPKLMLSDGTPNRTANWAIESAWQEWADEYASVDGVECWLEIERLLIATWATDGEIFIRRRKGWDNPHAFAVELIDPDLLDEHYNVPAKDGRNEITMGVEIDAFGRRVAYHFWDRHPDEPRKKRAPIPADEITHFFVRYRTGQNRGYSLFAPVLTTVEQVDGLTEAELVAARYHASKMGFITNDTPEAVQAYAARLRMQNEQGVGDRPRRVKMAPGIVEELSPGQSFVGFDPTHPNSAFDPFLKVMLRGVSRGFSMSYLTATGDVGEANYSSMRAGLLPERDHWRAVQTVTAKRVHRPVFRDWLDMARLTRAVRATVPYGSRVPVEFRGRRWQWVDPANDLQAAEAEVKLGLNSRQRLAADRGLDYEAVIDESKEDQTYAKEAGVYVGGSNAPQPAKPNGANGNGSSNGNGNGKPSARLLPYPLEGSDA